MQEAICVETCPCGRGSSSRVSCRDFAVPKTRHENSFNRKTTVTVTGKSATYRSGSDMSVVASPIEVLNHELDHAEMRLKLTFNEYAKLLTTPDKLLENGIEASAVRDSNELAKELGKTKLRTHYWKERKEWRKGSGIWIRTDDFYGGGDGCE